MIDKKTENIFKMLQKKEGITQGFFDEIQLAQDSQGVFGHNLTNITKIKDGYSVIHNFASVYESKHNYTRNLKILKTPKGIWKIYTKRDLEMIKEFIRQCKEDC